MKRYLIERAVRFEDGGHEYEPVEGEEYTTLDQAKGRMLVLADRRPGAYQVHIINGAPSP